MPVGQIKSGRFSAFVQRLREHHVVHLGDITADSRPNRSQSSDLLCGGGIQEREREREKQRERPKS